MTKTTPPRRVGQSALTAVWIALVVAGWVFGLVLIFLATGWPRWAFYLAVIGGTLVFVRATESRAVADERGG